jgi:DNA-binding MarR family transcriptional regulator
MYERNVKAVFDAFLALAEEGIVRDASLEKIASEAGVGRRSLCRAIDKLIEAGAIKRTHGIGRSVCNIYQITTPAQQKEE